MAGRSRVSRREAETADPGIRLESWKEIAAYLNRHVTTVRRWEKGEGLPIHRHRHGALGSIYAYAGELDTWFAGRSSTPAASESGPQPAWRCPLPPVLALHSTPLVPLAGRDAEWRVLSTAWETAQRAAQLVVISGEPGVGKTRLALDFARSVAAGATVLVGRCDSEGLVPFVPFVETLRWLVQAAPEDVLRAHLAGIDGGSELAQLVPALATRARRRPPSIAPTAEGRRYRMFEACAGFLRAVSRGAPILLVIEDLQWADRGTLLLLRHLVRSAPDASICTIVTYSAPAPARNPWTEEILSDLRREPSATYLPLEGLPEQHVRTLVNAWTSDTFVAHLAPVVAESTQGNPLFVIELLRHLCEPGVLSRLAAAPVAPLELGLPQSVREVIRRRLSGLSESTQRLLALGAVAGRDFDITTVESLAGLSEEAVLDGMDEAIAANVLREVPGAPGRCAFAHAVIRETLYAQLSAARRVRLHHRLAEAIEQRSGAGVAPLAELAHHYGQAASYRDARKALEYAVRAADHASSALALEDAARFYGMALQALAFLPDEAVRARRSELHERRGRSYFQAGQWESASQELEAALNLLEPHDQVKRCELLLRLAETAFWLMDVPGLRRFAGEAQHLADALHRDDLWADAAAWGASADVADGDVPGAIDSDRRAVARAGGIRSFGLARVPLTLYWAGHTAEAVERAAQAVEQARGSGDPAFLLYALQHAGLCLSGAGRYDEAIRAFDEAHAFGRRCGALPLLARALSMSVAPLLSLGDVEGAAMRALEARELGHRVGFEAPIVSAGIDLLVIGARIGDLDRSAALLPEVARAVEKASGWHAWKWRLRLWHARAELALARRDWTEALIAAGHVVEQSRARRRPKYEALGLSARARAEAGLGRNQQAFGHVQAAADAARGLGDPAVLLRCLTVGLELGAGEGVLGEANAAARRMLQAVSHGPLRRRFLASLPAAIAVNPPASARPTR